MCDINTWMGCFGGTCPKPTRLLAPSSWIMPLQKKFHYKDHFFTTTGLYTKKSGQVDGGPNLKQTQEYPAGYADAVFWAFVQAHHDGDFFKHVDLEKYQTPQNDDLWADADLQGVATYCGMPQDKLVY